jgi:hypothetical protein
MDNLLTSVPLARCMLFLKPSLVETMRKDKGEIPMGFLPKRDRVVNEPFFSHQENLSLVSYDPKQGKSQLAKMLRYYIMTIRDHTRL